MTFDIKSKLAANNLFNLKQCAMLKFSNFFTTGTNELMMMSLLEKMTVKILRYEKKGKFENLILSLRTMSS